MNFCRRLSEVAVARLPELMNVLEQLQKTRTPITRVWRKIGAAEEGFEIGSEKSVQWPAALPGRGLNKSHIDFVHIRPLFAIDFDADEIFIEERRDLFVFERLAFHHMAPMAGRISDAEKDRLILFPRLGESLLTPRIPIHRVMLMLQQVRRFLARQPIGMRMRC